MELSQVKQLSSLVRTHILRMTHKAGSGHPTSSFSSVDLASMLFFKHLRYDLDAPAAMENDRVIFSKGHASALMYSLFAAAGKVSDSELLSYREFRSPLEGHPTKRFTYTEAATGSLGQGLSIGAGEAWAINMIHESRITIQDNDKIHDSSIINHDSIPNVYVLLGDGELAEGSVWEAAAWASFHKLNHLIAIVDINGLGQSEATMYGRDSEIYKKRFEAFGWTTITIDGHSFEEIDKAYEIAKENRKSPFAILARTIKGKGVPMWEDKNGWHNRMLPPDELQNALESLKVEPGITGSIQKPEKINHDSELALPEQSDTHTSSTINNESYKPDEAIPTKKAFANALVRLGFDYTNLIVLDGDVGNSLNTDQFKHAYPGRFLQMYIAEQNMVGVAVGLAKRGFIPCVTTFGCFLSRAIDQIRMIHLSGESVLFSGSYVGVTLGKDGPSQMGLSDIAQFRSLPESVVLYPCDPYCTEYLVGEMLGAGGVVYIRTTRVPTPVIYNEKEQFPVGGSKLHPAKISEGERSAKLITVVAAGITLHEARKAQKNLEEKGIAIQVLDCYSVKPIDVDALKKAAGNSSAIIVVEDHYPEGGLGEAVRSALGSGTQIPVHHLAVYKTPMSGSPEELLAYEEIDADAIVKTVLSIKK